MTDVTIPDDYLPIVEGKLWKKILKEGSGESPIKKSNVNVHYVGTLFNNGDKFDSSRDRGSPFNFKLGVGQVIKGWDEGVKTMKIGELAELVCAPDYAYGASGSPPKIPGNSTLKFEVELLGFQEPADNPTAKLALAKKKKDQGNASFKAGENGPAAQAYKDGADALKDMDGATEEQLQESEPLKVALLANLAAAYLKLNENGLAAETCLKALNSQPDHVKVTYRLAQAYLGMSEFEDAKKTAQRGLEIAPGDATFTSLLSVISSKQAAFKKKEKAAYSKMFS
ncbi:cytochrome P450 monooxygenase 9 [Entomortierella chlamydospora]|uniref:peptidylprolyl isomerase n=1 Tax=Entomortierella chlamydospora TaxID=101097 RepID=A0A9P6T156_9FUNG|nr:cytochrome P450 monooxygenase 9 [Entomortierella chlamydospora]KAG0016971.1 cytochrome P450 monooxygenase 9 [Entomortierella chlamydospora]